MIIKRNCLFLLDKEKDKTDAKLRYRIKWEGNTVAFNVGYRVEVSKWISEAFSEMARSIIELTRRIIGVTFSCPSLAAVCP